MKKILAIFATALLLALCAIPCFAYPSQNLTFGGLYQNWDVAPYSVQEFRGDIAIDTATMVFSAEDLEREINGFILKVDIPSSPSFDGEIRLYLEEMYSQDYSLSNLITVNARTDTLSTFYFVVPRRGIDTLRLFFLVSEAWNFSDGDDPVVSTLYPISLNTDEIEESAYNSGFQGGYNDGLVDGQGVAEDLDGFLVDIFAALAEFFTPFASLEIWGISAMGVLSLIVVASIAIIIFKMK